MIGNVFAPVYKIAVDKLPDYAAVHVLYFRRFGKLPNVKSPKTFNEKIAWRKLYQRDPRFTLFADKVAVKAELAKLIGEEYLVETLWVGTDPAHIPFDRLAPPYVIKVNHSSGGNVFVRSERDVERERIIESIGEQLRFVHGHMSREWAYLGIPHRILVEPMIEMPGGDVPEDYKFYVYHGRVRFVQVDCGRFSLHARNLYDREWRLLPGTFLYPATSAPILRPEKLDEMIELAEKIGAQFDFVRVDLYCPPAGIRFGEATFYPEAGLGAFSPGELDRTFGEPWNVAAVRKAAGAPFPRRAG